MSILIVFSKMKIPGNKTVEFQEVCVYTKDNGLLSFDLPFESCLLDKHVRRWVIIVSEFLLLMVF